MATDVKSRGPSTYEKAFARVVERTLGHSAKSTPSRAGTAVLALLYEVKAGPGMDGLWGSEIARRIGQSQPNTTKLTLPRLQDMGLIEFAVQTNPRGGRPLHVWNLTEKGMDIGLLAWVESRGTAASESAKWDNRVSGLSGQSRYPARR
jgi:hypothetical protein